MAYSSKGKRPSEYASKSAHSKVIQDEVVSQFLSKCTLPKSSEEVDLKDATIIQFQPPKENPIKHIIALDGGYTEVFARRGFPSATIAYFQFGALGFKLEDLETIAKQQFIDPNDMRKLKEIERWKLVLPTKNVKLQEEENLTNTIRKTLYEFFLSQPQSDSLHFIDALKWLIFEEYNSGSSPAWQMAHCPECDRAVDITHSMIDTNYCFQCPHSACKAKLYLTDVFRLHEAIDNDLGAGGILGYVTTLVEQIILVYLIRSLIKLKPATLNEVLFIKDGSLGFFGQTANMQKPMQKLVKYLLEKHNLNLAGLEKSGAFVEHADAISSRLKPGSILLLSNEYIYKYITPGKADPSRLYGSSTYYGNKVIFKSFDEKTYVVTIPNSKLAYAPVESDFANLHQILDNISKLKCDMYDSALLPISLVNKLVSLSNHPSSVILEKFTKKHIG